MAGPGILASLFDASVDAQTSQVNQILNAAVDPAATEHRVQSQE
jgi:hypothetical protein